MAGNGNHSNRVLIVGAGIAGMQAALDIAGSGYEVVLVERLPSVGGHMHQLSETFPTLDCAQCIMTPRTVDVGRHDKIRLYVYSEVESVTGEIGDFRVRIRRKPAYVKWDLCTGCGACTEACPQAIPVAFDRRLEMPKAMASGKVRHVGTGKAIYTCRRRRCQETGDRHRVLHLLPERQMPPVRKGLPGGRHLL